MSIKRSSILDRIKQERERQVEIPGSEFDANNSPNDWIAIATYYLAQETRRATMLEAPSSVEFEKELIKAAAVIIAALEHTELMKDKGELS
jgi:hypothetical protein